MSVLRVATCQFPVGARIEANLGYVTRQLRAAKNRGADVAHFPEGALSGYAGADFGTFADFDWDALRQATTEVLRCAREAGIWVILGSSHRLSDANKPHNSLYVIDDAGRIVDRYDKRFCSGPDLEHYSPGDHARNVAGVLVTTVDTEQELYDSTAAWRGRALAGVLHSGTLVNDPRSADRTTL